MRSIGQFGLAPLQRQKYLSHCEAPIWPKLTGGGGEGGCLPSQSRTGGHSSSPPRPKVGHEGEENQGGGGGYLSSPPLHSGLCQGSGKTVGPRMPLSGSAPLDQGVSRGHLGHRRPKIPTHFRHSRPTAAEAGLWDLSVQKSCQLCDTPPPPSQCGGGGGLRPFLIARVNGPSITARGD